MSTHNKTGPAFDLTDPMLAHATKIVETAIAEHCRGGDLWLCAAMAAQKIIGEIAQESHHRFAGCEFDPSDWRRMPPSLRAAIAKAIGAKA